MMSGESVVVFRTKDPVEGEMVLDLLRQEGVEARLLGTRNAALVGVGMNVFDLKIEVVPDDAEEAAQIIDAYVKGEREKSDAQPDEPDGGEPDEPERPQRRPLLAAGAALVCPGGAHFYARRPITGLMLVVGYVLALGALANGHHDASTCGALIFAGLVVADLAGGQRAVRAFNRGERAGVLRELGAGALLLAITFGLGILIGTHLPPPKPSRASYYYSQP